MNVEDHDEEGGRAKDRREIMRGRIYQRDRESKKGTI